MKIIKDNKELQKLIKKERERERKLIYNFVQKGEKNNLKMKDI